MPFYHQATGVEGYPIAELSDYQVFYGTDPRISVIEQPYLEILPLQDFVSPTTPFGFEVSRYDGSNQRRSTGYALALPIPSLLYTSMGNFEFSCRFLDMSALMVFFILLILLHIAMLEKPAMY